MVMLVLFTSSTFFDLSKLFIIDLVVNLHKIVSTPKFNDNKPMVKQWNCFNIFHTSKNLNDMSDIIQFLYRLFSI